MVTQRPPPPRTYVLITVEEEGAVEQVRHVYWYNTVHLQRQVKVFYRNKQIKKSYKDDIKRLFKYTERELKKNSQQGGANIKEAQLYVARKA